MSLKYSLLTLYLHKLGAFCLPIIQIVWETIKDIQSGKAPTASGNNSAATGDFL
jgi:hypothetical protein